MDQLTMFGYVTTLLSAFGGIGTLAHKLDKQRDIISKSTAQVGALGWCYAVAREYPARLLWTLLVVLSLFSLYIAIQGSLYMGWKVTLLDLPTLAEFGPIILLGVVLLAFCTYFEAPTRAALFLLERIGSLKFNSGCISARLQVGKVEVCWAMNHEPRNCEALGIALLDAMISSPQPPAEEAPTLTGISEAERANYVFFGCAIEHHVHRLSRDRAALNDMWKYLAWAASTTERPFTPTSITNHYNQKKQLFDTLKELRAAHQTEVRGVLPTAPAIVNVVEGGVGYLGSKWAGDASRLAKSLFGVRTAPSVLFRRLESVEPFKDSEAIRRLFLKLCVRMRVWPKMRPGPFLYPFNSGIALLMLNSRCLLVSEDVSRIDPSSQFEALVAATEDKVIASAHAQFMLRKDDPEVLRFSQQMLRCAPADADEWRFKDLVDLWLFTHTRSFCTVKTREDNPAPCSLSTGPRNCFCVGPPVFWWRDGMSLVKTSRS